MGKSLWIVDSEETNYPKLEKKESADVCIIGGGLTGIITAYLLEKRGVNVVLLEKNKICMGVTANSTAKITSQHGLFYKYLKNENGIDFVKKYLKANEEGIQLAKKIIKSENINCDFEEKDAYVFATCDNELKKIYEEVNVLKEIGYDAEFVKDINIPVENCLGAIKFKNQGQFNPRKYCIDVCKKICDLGGKVFENSMVLDVKKDGEKYLVYTETAEVVANKVVIASHYPIKNFPGMYFAKMYQDKSYIIAVDLNDEQDKDYEKNKFDLDGMYLQSCNPIISFRMANYGDKRLMLIAGSGHKTGKNDANIENCYINLENYIKKFFKNSKTVFKWSTEDCVSLDKVPYIGQFSNFWPNVYVATGFKKWGMSSAHAAGIIISDLIVDGYSEYEDVFKATRFNPIKNVRELGNVFKESTYSLFLNKLKDSKETFEGIKFGDGGIIEIDGKKVGIYKREDGKIFAVKPICGHLGCLVSWNNLEKTWDCPCHGSRYDYMGNVITEPTVKGLKGLERLDFLE